ncbi:MAG: acyl-CoA dehydrogenase family protein [Acidimicrobiia bacterium]|nr:acyl-CoA dehydrogenase family protein [Acidimicrobiia bacterium]
MTIVDTNPSIEDFKAAATAFLETQFERRSDEAFEWGKGDDRVGVLEEKSPDEEAMELAAAKAFKASEFDAGFGWITGPSEYGGSGLSAGHERAYREITSQYSTPNQSMFGIGLGMVAPTILAHAIPEVRERYLRSMHRGEIVGCQLFSEPIAGSDLAGIQTKAVLDGDEWIVTGQKVWTSGAHYSDIGEIITRTDPEKPKHRGLTMLLVDMHAPGVEIRPLRQMTGGASFNEVFFNEVRVPTSHLLGDVDGGWSVALTTLMNERAAIGGGGGGVGTMSMTRFIELAKFLGCSDDPITRQRLADIYIRGSVARFTNLRAMAKIRLGQLPGPEMSIAKLALTENMSLISQLLGEMLGARMIADTGEWGTYAWNEFVLGVPGMRIAGGTDEVMRNIVGERVLGLPKEPKPA